MAGKSRLKIGHIGRFLVGGCESRQRRQGRCAGKTHPLKLQFAQQAHGAYTNRVGRIHLMAGKSRLKLHSFIHCYTLVTAWSQRAFSSGGL